MQQNETIVKRYLESNDLYFHADYHGAPSVVLKNPEKRVVGEASLNQAAQYSVALSKAWSDKVVCSAYYVFANQVSKTAPSGEYLPTGSFMIRGKKNFVSPSRVTLGLGMLYVVKERTAEDVDFVIPPVQEQPKQSTPPNTPSCDVVSSTSVRSILCDDESESEDENEDKNEESKTKSTDVRTGDKEVQCTKEPADTEHPTEQENKKECEHKGTEKAYDNTDVPCGTGKRGKQKRGAKRQNTTEEDEVFFKILSP